MENNLKIKDLRPELRPDEKFLRLGPKALSDAELLAIIIRTGSGKEHSVALSERILSSGPDGNYNILNIFDLDINDLISINGVGTVKALQIKALAELSVRISKSRAAENLLFNEPSSIARYYMEQLRHLKREVVVLIMLNNACRFIKDEFLFEGTVAASLLSPREIFLDALKCGAVYIILLHNHPSGDPSPSSQDIASTKRVSEAGAIIGIQLLDHIIIGDNKYISLKEEGMFDDGS